MAYFLAWFVNALSFVQHYIELLIWKLLWMNVMLDFICIGFGELWAKGSKRNIQNENMPPPGFEPAIPCFPACCSNHSAIGAVNDMLLKLLQYLLTLLSINTCGNACMKLIWLDVYWNWPSDKICISFTNIDGIYYCLQNFVWTNLTIINFILALSHILINSSVKK